VLALEPIACPLCGSVASRRLCAMRDLALGVPGEFPLARCEGCGLLYQNPRVRVDQLDLAYPPGYGPHAREAELGRTLRRLDAGGRWFLATRLGYAHLRPERASAAARLHALRRRRKYLDLFPPWLGQGRLLDVGCANGRFLLQMGAVGWQLAGVEFDPEAAAKARAVTPDVFEGDPAAAPFAPGRFDLVTAFHVVEHLPDPLRALRRMIEWLAPGGLMIVEVPNAGGLGARLFGRYWSGLDFPRHLVHFTPRTMQAMVARAGGRIERAGHRTKPRYLIRSLRHLLGDRSGSAAARAALAVSRSRAGAGAMKLALEAMMPLARPAGLGEAVRYFIRRA
jgi:SAM-dependent methyltransferase